MDGYKPITQDELDKKLGAHKLWLAGDRINGRRLDLTGYDLSGLNLFSANLYSAILKGTRIDGADLRFANLKTAHLEGAVIDNSRCQYADFCNSHCQGMSAKGIQIARTGFIEANLAGVDMGGAISGKPSHFAGAYLEGMKHPDGRIHSDKRALTQERLNEIEYEHAQWLADPSQGKRADLSGVDLRGLSLAGMDFRGVNAMNASFEGCDCAKADFGSVELPDGRKYRANFANANFAGANLTETKWQGTLCLRTVFNGAVADYAAFRETIVEKAQCVNSSFVGCDLTGLKAKDSVFHGANMLDAYGAFQEDWLHPNDFTDAFVENSVVAEVIAARPAPEPQPQPTPPEAKAAEEPAKDGREGPGVEAAEPTLDARGAPSVASDGPLAPQIKRLTQTDVDETLVSHTLWAYGGNVGKKADFSYCDLTGLDLSDTVLKGIDFTGAVAVAANFEDSTCTECIFRDTDLTAAKFAGADVSNAIFHGAKCYAADLEGVTGLPDAIIDKATDFANAILPKDYLGKLAEEEKYSPLEERDSAAQPARAEAPQAAVDRTQLPAGLETANPR